MAEDDCGRISFRLTTEDAETVLMTAIVRAGKTVTSVPTGPVYVSPSGRHRRRAHDGLPR